VSGISITKKEEEEMNKFIDENLATGRIRRSESEIASPFFFVKKKTADLRPVQDYRKVNEKTRNSRYPLPLINECWTKSRRLSGSQRWTLGKDTITFGCEKGINGRQPLNVTRTLRTIGHVLWTL